MNQYVVLLRAVNVGGKNLLPMKELKLVLEGAGFEGVQTYIQSGNIVLSSKGNPEPKIKVLVKAEFGFTPEIMVVGKADFDLAVYNNPYLSDEGKLVHFYFCNTQPPINTAKLQKAKSTTEECCVVDKVFYLYVPDGVGRSKLVANIEACLGVPTTGRNLNTIGKISTMMGKS